MDDRMDRRLRMDKRLHMDKRLKTIIESVLSSNRLMALASIGGDGGPACEPLRYMNDGLILYCFTSRSGKLAAAIARDPRVAAALGKDNHHPLETRWIALSGGALLVDDRNEIDHARALLVERHPELRVIPSEDRKTVALLRVTPETIVLSDYERGYGHTDEVRVDEDDLADFADRHRHHWARDKVGRRVS
jgi:general stress protein 26